MLTQVNRSHNFVPSSTSPISKDYSQPTHRSDSLGHKTSFTAADSCVINNRLHNEVVLHPYLNSLSSQT